MSAFSILLRTILFFSFSAYAINFQKTSRKAAEIIHARRQFQKFSHKEMRDITEEMFNHAFDSYMKYAFPMDELNPIACNGRKRADRGSIDDVLADYSLTLVDSLSTLAVMGRQKQFSDGVWWVAKNVHFNRNYSVSVFELTIRGLGGLLSAHALASDKRLGLVPEYNNELIPVAVDLADRLLKAFKTPTGLPVHKVHLQNGLESNESRKTCTACAGTLLMEFALLSHYTDDMKYHDAAWGAMMRLVNSTSPIHLAGSMIDVDTGEWTGQEFGIGSGVDSFLEYTLKASFFLSSDVLHQKFHQMYESLLHHSKASGFYFNIHMRTGRLSSRTVDSLSAFWPGLQVLMGDLHNAVQTFEAYFKLWRAYGFIPETFNVGQGSFGWGYGYPLRPELAESLYFLYQATGNSYYVDCAREMVASIETFAKTKCGYATIANVVDFRLEDRMDSYFFSETLKYLFLIFDDAVHRNGGARKPSTGHERLHFHNRRPPNPSTVETPETFSKIIRPLAEATESRQSLRRSRGA
eukprot:TRINITY_DN6059_c0_g1_i2.p1 TRINITY_DN6059_c0_g1~~TRINITY_DN6059_c0_g1_i2.p1  ORF type:complete len:523 (+),score=74.10 TRINITY_DN6059_c0_g1_i2:71-1639(+)